MVSSSVCDPCNVDFYHHHTYILPCSAHVDHIQKGALPGASVEEATEEGGHHAENHRIKMGSYPQRGTDFIRRNIEVL